MSKARERIYAQYVESFGGTSSIRSTADLADRAPTMNRVINHFFPKDRHAAILDLGCGHGTLVHFAKRSGYQEVRGVDVSEQQVALARKLGIDAVQQGDLVDTLESTPPSSLDAVVAFDVIEHFTKDELIDLVDAVRDALKPGGRWIIHAPNGASPFVGAVRFGDFTHELAFTQSSLEQLLKASGFKRVECFECSPRAHGIKSLARVLIWSLVRFGLRVAQVAETGDMANKVFTRNLYAVAYK